MAIGVSGNLPTYFQTAYTPSQYGNGLNISPHYVEEYYPDGNYSIVKIDYIDYTSTYYSQSLTWGISGTININGTPYEYSGSVKTGSYEANRFYCNITSGQIYHNNDGTKSITITLTKVYATGEQAFGTSEGTLSTATISLTDIPIKHTLSISSGTGSSIIVQRTSSNVLSTGTLSNGDTIYEGDKLTITFTASDGYNIATHTVNGSSHTSGVSYTVPPSLSGNTLHVVSTTTVKSYTLSISAGTGSTITVNRTSSPKQGASTGNLSNGATIYHSDILKISLSANTGYNVGTLTVNGSTFISGNSHTVDNNVAVSSTASVQSYKLSISADKGSTITVNRTSSPKQVAGTGTLSNGATIYYDDVLKITFASTPEYEILVQTVNGSAFTSGGSHTVTGAVTVSTTTRILGIIYIDNGTKFEKYMVFVDNGTSWDQYIPYIDNGTKFVQYS